MGAGVLANLQICAVVVGIAAGAAAVGIACIVWARKQVFGLGGSTLCMAGVVLLGLSIWSSVELDVGPVRFIGILNQLNAAVERSDQASKSAQAADEAAKEVAASATPANANKAADAAAKAAKAAADAKAASENANRIRDEVRESFSRRHGAF